VAVRFEDVHDFPGNHDYYAVPNERLSKWQELVQGLRVYRAAGICSGGEVGLFALLPIVRSSLTLVDHSYRSLYYAMVKYLALEKYGAEETYRRLTNATHEDLKRLAAEVEADLPEAVRGVWKTRTRHDYDYYDNRPRVVEPGEPFTRKGTSVPSFWRKQKPDPLVRSCKKLSRVTFMHGDLSDLTKRGQFDLIYLSNALEHQTRDGGYASHRAIEQALKPGGHILLSGRRGYARYGQPAPRIGRAPQHWEPVVETELRSDGGNEIAWGYALYKVPEAVAA
jgi:SAM-dependent methyltransferase